MLQFDNTAVSALLVRGDGCGDCASTNSLIGVSDKNSDNTYMQYNALTNGGRVLYHRR